MNLNNAYVTFNKVVALSMLIYVCVDELEITHANGSHFNESHSTLLVPQPREVSFCVFLVPSAIAKYHFFSLLQ